MSTPEEYQTLSQPSVYVNGELLSVIPNSVSQTQPGDRTVRAVSSGAGSSDVVFGLDATTLKGRVSFALPVTAGNVSRIEQWSELANELTPVPISVTTPARQTSYERMMLVEAPEQGYEAEGQVELTFEGTRPIYS